MQNIIAVIFKNESEGFQAIAELRNAPVTAETAILQMALVKKGETGLNWTVRHACSFAGAWRKNTKNTSWISARRERPNWKPDSRSSRRTISSDLRHLRNTYAIV